MSYILSLYGGLFCFVFPTPHENLQLYICICLNYILPGRSHKYYLFLLWPCQLDSGKKHQATVIRVCTCNTPFQINSSFPFCLTSFLSVSCTFSPRHTSFSRTKEIPVSIIPFPDADVSRKYIPFLYFIYKVRMVCTTCCIS